MNKDYSSSSPSADGEATRLFTGRIAFTVISPGTLLANTYVIENLLARGGMGEVYRAKHVELGTEHAIKTILPSLADDPKVMQLFREEARKLGRLNSDAIVDYQGFLRDERGLLYLVTEFVDGESLEQILRRRRLEPREVVWLRNRLARGLAAAHEIGIVHRDVSPENILIPEGKIDRAKIIDFGIAKSIDPLNPTLIGEDFAGKYSYASPEQLGLFGGRVDLRSDIYSLGLVLAAAAIGFGKRLDMGSSAAAMITARQKGPDLSEVPVSLRPIIRPMLEPRPDDRPPSMRALLDDDKELGLGRTELGLQQPPPRSWRRRVVLAAVFLFAIITFGGAGMGLLRLASPPPPANELRTQVAAAAAGYECSALDYGVDASRSVRVSGYVAKRADIDRLREELHAIGGIAKLDYAVGFRPWPFCEATKILEPLLHHKPRVAAALALTSNNAAMRVGEPLQVDVRAPSFDGYLYVDYFDSEGDVAHLFPNSRDQLNFRPALNHLVLGKAPLAGRWTLAGSTGEQLMTLIASAEPLFDVIRPPVEHARDYLPGLAMAIARLPGDGKTASVLFFALQADETVK
jgi:Protein kinase domain/Domain of unknown function (DUF4384)